MNREEKAKYDKELVERFIVNADYEEKDLEDLSIQDLCVLVNGANGAMVNKTVEGAEKEMPKLIQKLLGMVIDKIRTADRLYTVIDNATGFPFIDEHADDAIWLFSTEQYAKEAVEHYATMYRKFSLQAIDNSNLSSFAEYMYLNGIYGAYIDNGYAGCIFRKEELFPAQVNENEPMPIMNPEFMLAHLEMVQEASWQVDYEQRQTVLNNLQNEVVNQLVKAKFLVPVNTEDGAEVTPENIKIPCLEAKDGRSGIPLFTDWNQFRMAYSVEEFQGMTVTYEDIVGFIKDDKIVVINPASCFFEINANNMKAIDSIARGEM